jgi:hypothetical protein
VNAKLLGYRPDAGRHQTGRNDRVAAFCRDGDRVELHRDEVGRRLRCVGRCERLVAVQHLAQRRAHGDERHVDPRREVREVRWCAYPRLDTELAQCQRECDQRLDIPA